MGLFGFRPITGLTLLSQLGHSLSFAQLCARTPSASRLFQIGSEYSPRDNSIGIVAIFKERISKGVAVALLIVTILLTP